MIIGDRNIEVIDALGVGKGREAIRNRNKVPRDKNLSIEKKVNRRETKVCRKSIKKCKH